MKIATSPEKSHPPLSQQPPLKDEFCQALPLFENLDGGSTPPPPPPPAEKRGVGVGGGVHTMNWQ